MMMTLTTQYMEKQAQIQGLTPDLEAYLDRATALELARRSLLGAPVFVVISLIMLIFTPVFTDFGWWGSVAEASMLVLLGVVRFWFGYGFERRYDLIGEKAVVQFSILTAIQNLTLGVLSAVVIYRYWASQDVVLTIILSAGVVAASTSALSVRQSAHFIFLICVLGPFAVAVFLIGGLVKTALIVGYLALMAFLVQDGGKARRIYKKLVKEQYERQQERLRAEADLRKLALAVEQSPESIIITNLKAEIEYVNQAFLKISGYSREEVLGRNPRFRQSGKTPPETFREMWAALTDGRAWKGEFYNRRKDGSEIVELARIAPLSQPDGKITHYVGIQEDITRKKQLAEELEHHRSHLEELVEQRTEQLAEAREQAEAANRAKSVFLANMSHEIRTPMTAIIGFTDLLRRTEPRADQEERLASIDAAAEDLLAIINDILDVAKIEAGKLDLHPSDFHINRIFDPILSLLEEKAKNKGLTIEVGHIDTPAWLRGDPVRLRQALLNYASNAVKFTEQGTVSLRARKMEEQGDEILIRFEVQDTGFGIEPDRLRCLFEAFEQAHTPGRQNQFGTGLGLAITRHLARLMGGEAGAESAPGVGSTFWFTARLGRGRADQPVTPPGTPESAEKALRTGFKGSRILVVEDNEINRILASTLLGNAGLAVDTAEDGLEAVAKSRTITYDLILMDIQMPNMDGMEATRVIRSMASNKDTPILALTANVYEEAARNYLDAGMNDIITKPFNPEQLYSMIGKWLQRSARGS